MSAAKLSETIAMSFNLTVPLLAGHPDERRLLGGHQGGRGAGATIRRKNATGPALIVSWRGSVIARGKRGKAEIETGTEGTGTEGGPAAQTGTKSGESAEEATVAAGTERASVKTRRETAAMTGTGGRRGSIIKTGVRRERSPGTRRAGENQTTEDTKRTGTGTGRRGRPRGQAGVGVGTESIKAAERRKAGNEIAATAEIESEREMGSSDPTKGAAAKSGATTSESPATITVNTANAGGVGALSKTHFRQYFYFGVVLPPFSHGCPISAKININTWGIGDTTSCNVILLCLFSCLFPLLVRLLAFT